MKLFVINLDRVPERWTFVRDQFHMAGLTEGIERISATDAQAADFLAPGYAPHSWRDRWELTPGEQAIFESHRKLWHSIARDHPDGGVICEDDILVSRDFASVLRVLPEMRSGLVKLDGVNAARRYGPVRPEAGLAVRAILETAPSAACYYVSQGAAGALLEASRTYCETLDDFLFSPQTVVPPVQVWPAVAVQGMFCDPESDTVPQLIAQSERSPQGNTRSAHKGPASYRLLKEARRMHQRLTRRFGADKRLSARGGLTGWPPLAEDLPSYRA